MPTIITSKSQAEPDPIPPAPAPEAPPNPLAPPTPTAEPAPKPKQKRKKGYIPKFLVIHAGVGQWSKDDKIPADLLPEDVVQRLLDLGAITPEPEDVE